MSVSANDIISGALRVISSLTPGEGIPGAEADNALTVLNWMLASWSAKQYMIPYKTTEQFSLTLGQTSFTIGPGANMDTVRPDEITYCFRRDPANNDYPMSMYTQEQYSGLQNKFISGIPQWYFYDPQFPNGVLNIYQSESQPGCSIFIESLKPLNQFTNLQTLLALPGEYQEASKYLLAQRLAPEYGFSITQDIAELIQQADNFIRRKNVKPKAAMFDPAVRSAPQFNIYTG